MITVTDLPERPAYGVQLYCPRCGGEYSATRGDYFWMPTGKPFRCQSCRERLRLVQKRTMHEEIAEEQL